MLTRCALLLLALSGAYAQTAVGELRLSVLDAGGAPIPAHVSLVSQSTRTEQAIDLPPDGRYIFKKLPFGFYRLEISRSGFAASTDVIEIRSAIPQSRSVTLGVLA